MASPAFALSPMTARAASPTDADFEAIRQAFLETARGRWFLDEYAKRNRNADTAMVLEAVARIERTLAAQKDAAAPPKEDPKPQQQPEVPQPPADHTEILAAVRAIVSTARDNISTALSGPLLEQALAPSRKCARVIREIAWGLRESGADGRICSLLDNQVEAINAACAHMAAGGFREGVLSVVDQAARQIDDLSAKDGPSFKSVASSKVAPTAIRAVEPSLAVPIRMPKAAPLPPVKKAELTETVAPAPVSPVAATSPASTPAAVENHPTAFADQLAIIVETTERQTTRPQDTPSRKIPDQTLPSAEAVASAEAASEPTVPAAQMSLGESLIASGIIAKPNAARNDPLAPFRKMSLAEKIAFFS